MLASRVSGPLAAAPAWHQTAAVPAAGIARRPPVAAFVADREFAMDRPVAAVDRPVLFWRPARQDDALQGDSSLPVRPLRP